MTAADCPICGAAHRPSAVAERLEDALVELEAWAWQRDLVFHTLGISRGPAQQSIEERTPPTPVDALSHVREQVRTRRRHQGMTGKAFAARLAVVGSTFNHATLAGFESGRRDLRINEVYDLAAALNCSVHDLLP